MQGHYTYTHAVDKMKLGNPQFYIQTETFHYISLMELNLKQVLYAGPLQVYAVLNWVRYTYAQVDVNLGTCIPTWPIDVSLWLLNRKSPISPYGSQCIVYMLW